MKHFNAKNLKSGKKRIFDTFEGSLRAIEFGRLIMFYLEKCKNEALKLNNYEGLTNVIEYCISELQWWQWPSG